MDTGKIKIESHGISPWHYYLENMSWGFSRKQDDEDMMAFLNVDSTLKNGGRGLEDVLMADFLQSLDFADRLLLDRLLEKAQCREKLKDAEIRGNAGNYYLPYEDTENGVRLAQPDGWIADADTLILLEAKGYRKSAALNKGQLVKEFLVAQSVANHTSHKNFFVLLIAESFENIYKGNDKKNYGISNFKDLWDANLTDFYSAFKNTLGKAYDSLKNTSIDDIKSHFLWITWNEIQEEARNHQGFCASEIVRAIVFHSADEKELTNTVADDSWPVFSQCRAELAKKKEPLYHFYNGGCGNKTLQAYEKKYLDKIPQTESPWKNWHELSAKKSDQFTRVAILEERRRIALSLLQQVKKDINLFYKDVLPQVKVADTTRKAFEILGESANTKAQSAIFEQRMEGLVGKIFPEGKN